MSIGNQVTLTSNVASKVISVIATASQTVFTVQGGYRINQLSVYRSGVRLVDSIDYTARDGSSVTLFSPAALNDVLEFQVFDDFRVADAIVSSASNQTIVGNLNVNGTLTATTFSLTTLFGSEIKNYTEVISVIGNTSTAATLNLANGNVFTATLTDNCTFTFTTGVVTGAASFTLVLLNDATSGRSIVWPASVKWPNNVIPVRTTASNATDIWSFFTPNNGTTWYGNIALYNLT
jgi:hypothetical protein